MKCQVHSLLIFTSIGVGCDILGFCQWYYGRQNDKTHHITWSCNGSFEIWCW